MKRVVRVALILSAVLAFASAASGAAKAPIVAAGSGGLETGFAYLPHAEADGATQFQRMKAAGAKYVRITVDWSAIAPAGEAKPAGFDASNPNDPLYNWAGLDALMLEIVNAGLQPILEMQRAPIWAQGTTSSRPDTPGGFRPNATEFGNFTRAAAERYSGGGGVYGELPRVRYWSVWNEPNLTAFLSPQLSGGKVFAPTMYRSLVNAASTSIHSVHADNVVIAGETSPYGAPAVKRTKPLDFMEKTLCISEKWNSQAKIWTYKSSCKSKTSFDVWAHHPYTEGGPTRKGRLRGNVSLGDLPDMRKVLNTALAAGHVRSKQKARLWVTEFSWDSRPPDPEGVAPQLLARWVSHALYQAWSSGVSNFLWFIIRDMPYSQSYYQSGLYYASPSGIEADTPKPALRAFRFPFVAFPDQTGKVLIWGRTPNSRSAKLLIQRKSGAGWRTVKTMTANRTGIFKTKIARPADTQYLRARLSDGSDYSVPFSLKAPTKLWQGCVFGGMSGHRCTAQQG